MKRVLIDLNKLSNLHCGLGQVALNFGKALSESDTNLELNFLVPSDFVGHFGDKVNYYTSKDISKHKNDFDLWHCIHQEPTILPDNETKLLITIHDLNFLGEKSDRKASKRLKKLQNIVNKADRLAFISEFSRKSALENLTYNKNNTIVIYNGVCTSNEVSIPNEKMEKFFFSIGVFKAKKNFHILIPVMKYFPEHKLIIAGDTTGPYYKELIKTSKKLGLEKQIVFPGLISEQEKTWYYKNCDAFLFPSLYEGFGLPVIEAMRNGVPVITSNKTSLPEIGGGHTFIFEDFEVESIKSAIENGINSYSGDNNHRDNAVLYAMKFNWRENIMSYVDTYQIMIKNLNSTKTSS